MFQKKRSALRMLILASTSILGSSQGLGIHFQLLEGERENPGAPLTGRFRVTEEGQQESEAQLPIQIRRIEFRRNLDVNWNFVPFQDIPEGRCGQARKQIVATIRYQGADYPWEHTYPHDYPIRGEWNVQEDPGGDRRLAHLLLSVRDDYGRQIDLTHERPPVEIPYTFVDQEAEVEAGFLYDGNRLSRIRTRQQRWRDPHHPEVIFQKIATQFLPELPQHEGRTFVFAQPFLGVHEAPLRGGYRGRYVVERDLPDGEKYPHITEGSLIYQNAAGKRFLPHLTHKVLRRNGDLVRFVIASFRESDSLSFVPGASLQGALNRAGLYQMVSIETENPNNQAAKRLERWFPLEQDVRPGTVAEGAILVRTPLGVPAVPGMSQSPLDWPQGNAAGGVISGLQRDMAAFSQRIRGNAEFQSGLGRAMFLGPVGVGKTTLLSYLLGDMRVQMDPQDVQLNLVPLNPRDELNIGHRLGMAGTTEPVLIRDGDQFLGDLQGLGDPAGPARDLFNAYAINELFSPPANVKIILTAPESFLMPEAQRGQNFIKLVRQLVESFPADDLNWRTGIGLVLTQGTNPQIEPRRLLQLILGMNKGDLY